MLHQLKARRAFTLVELLVVIGIIAILIGILIPVVGKMRRTAHVADTKNFITQLSGAIERYHNDFGAYPGPLKNDEINQPMMTSQAPIVAPATAAVGFVAFVPSTDLKQLTMSENLVLGLLGGLRYDAALSKIVYDPSVVGQGPNGLNTSAPKKYGAYFDARNLSWRTVAGAQTGQYADDAGSAIDSVIPEFVDRFPAPMPVLYLRAKLGAVSTSTLSTDNPIFTNDPNMTKGRPGAFDLSQIVAYTGPDSSGHYIGEEKNLKGVDYQGTPLPPRGSHGLSTVNPAKVTNKNDTANYQYPYDAYPYFKNPAIPNAARGKDGYILISAGADRIYGTNDDITSFGDVAP